MASPTSTEASEIKRRGRHRLIGAIAIVVLLVVFVPMVLDSEPRVQRRELATDIPAKEHVPPLPAPTPPAASTTAAAPKESAPPVKAAPPAPVPAAAAVAEAPKLEGFAVQVGAFRDEDKLGQAREKLTAAGLKHYIERRGELTRLRAGPFATRDAAEKALVSIKAAALDGQVVPLQ